MPPPVLLKNLPHLLLYSHKASDRANRPTYNPLRFPRKASWFSQYLLRIFSLLVARFLVCFFLRNSTEISWLLIYLFIFS